MGILEKWLCLFPFPSKTTENVSKCAPLYEPLVGVQKCVHYVGSRVPMTSQICPYSLTLDPQKPKRQVPDPPPTKPTITKSITIIKDCCGATQCCIM